MLADDLRGVYYILLKDLKAYYFKPPNISWGILFPLVLTLAFSLRNPVGLLDLAPGLIAMAAVFGTTSMEAIVITFERRTGALERLLIAPISLWAVLMAKVLGGAVFGLMISGVMTVISVVTLGMKVTAPIWFLTSLILTLLTLSARARAQCGVKMKTGTKFHSRHFCSQDCILAHKIKSAKQERARRAHRTFAFNPARAHVMMPQ